MFSQSVAAYGGVREEGILSFLFMVACTFAQGSSSAAVDAQRTIVFICMHRCVTGDRSELLLYRETTISPVETALCNILYSSIIYSSTRYITYCTRSTSYRVYISTSMYVFICEVPAYPLLLYFSKKGVFFNHSSTASGMRRSC